MCCGDMGKKDYYKILSPATYFFFFLSIPLLHIWSCYCGKLVLFACARVHTAGRHGVWGVWSQEWALIMLDGKTPPTFEATPVLYAFMKANLKRERRNNVSIKHWLLKSYIFKLNRTFFYHKNKAFVNISECQGGWKEQHTVTFTIVACGQEQIPLVSVKTGLPSLAYVHLKLIYKVSVEDKFSKW